MANNTIHGPYGQEIPRSSLFLMVSSGWHDIIEELVNDLFALGWNGSLHQVKEKFGGLRFYVGEETQEMSDRIRVAEKQSFATCERCGTTDDVTVAPVDGWWITLCNGCRQGSREHLVEELNDAE